MKTAVVILNWNGKDFLRTFLPGLVDSVRDMDAEVIVADNASEDGSTDWLREEMPELKLLCFDRNYGFTGGYNRAFRELEEYGPEYFVLINSDIEVGPDWLFPLQEWMDLHEDCAACAPKLHSWQEGRRSYFEYAGAAGGWLDHYGYPFCRGRVMSRLEEDQGQYDDPADVLWATGACLMVRSSVWKKLGGLDERFFAHMEEIDFCWRARLDGWRVNVVPRSVVYHVGGGTLPQDSPFKLYLNYRNNLLMLGNNLAPTLAFNNIYDVLAGTAPEIASSSDDLKSCLDVLDEMDGAFRDKLVSACAADACRRAKFRIFRRMVLDVMASMVYLLKGKGSYFKSVWKAHRDYRELKRSCGRDEVEALLERDLDSGGNIAARLLDIDLNRKMGDRVKVRGILDEYIILLNCILRDGIFDYLKEKTK